MIIGNMRVPKRAPALLLLSVLVVVFTGCMRPSAPPRTEANAEEDFVVHGRQAVVATADRRATAAGVRMLGTGGNAIDAFAASSFAISVVRPQSTGIGGGGFAVVHLAREARDLAVDFRERAAGAAQRDMFLDASLPEKASLFSPLSVAIPGVVAGVLELHERYGRLPREEVMAPAIELAERGFPVYPGLAGAIAKMEPLLSRYAATAKIFLPDGKALQAGEILRQSDLAHTLREIAAKGREPFYRGPIAQAITAEMQRIGGILTRDDLAAYKVIDRSPLRAKYRDFDIVTMPPPSSGVLLIEMMNMLKAAGPGAAESSEADRIHLLAEVMRRAYEDRAEYLGDPDFVPIPLDRLLSAEHAVESLRDFDPHHATPRPQVAAEIRPTTTSHLSILDADGNAVSATESVNYAFGSGITVPGTGILLNNTMDDFATQAGVPNAYGLIGANANAVAAGKTPLSSMSPTIVLSHGQPMLLAGSPGGSLIITATLQTILNVVDRKMELPAAVEAPRIHHQAVPNQINYEPGAIDASTEADLERRGHVLKELPRMGDVQAVQRLPFGGVVGVSDPRGEGRPGGF